MFKTLEMMKKLNYFQYPYCQVINEEQFLCFAFLSFHAMLQ